MSEQYGKHISAFQAGEADAFNNRGCKKGHYPKDHQVAYQNGYSFGQQRRAAHKHSTKQQKRG